MNSDRFSRLTRFVAQRASRRGLIAALGFAGITIPGVAGAKRRHKKRKKKNVIFNAFGCVDVGKFCQNGTQCCSGICEGKKGKKKCRAHDASTCTDGDGCAGEFVACTPTVGDSGNCAVTTGNASYCGTIAVCFDCTKDADCVPVCGIGAACIVCAECARDELETACASLSDDGCILV
jgi:hypothetical protein